MTCVSYSTGQESKGLSRKSYRGRWIPGDPLTGSGGGCSSPTFLQVQNLYRLTGKQKQDVVLGGNRLEVGVPAGECFGTVPGQLKNVWVFLLDRMF